jgi:hypothetical protein
VPGSRTSNLLALANACEAVLALNEFWVLAELTDCSYEVGTKTPLLKQIVQLWREECGLSKRLEAQLHNGINGNLATALGCRQNKGAGQDFSFGGNGTALALAEVKLAHTVTMPKWYPCIAGDCAKLSLLRPGFDGDLFLAVFFAHLPNYWYPASSFKGEPVVGRVFRNEGIRDQFDRTRHQIGAEPAWPKKHPPRRRVLTQPPPGVLRVARLWCKQFLYAEPWQFDPAKHLKDGQVAFAIWQIA